MTFVYHLINGIHVGSVYALVAIGYSMVYGIVKLINFAHGDIIMVGAYIAWFVISVSGLPVWVGILASIVFCTLLGISIYVFTDNGRQRWGRSWCVSPVGAVSVKHSRFGPQGCAAKARIAFER